MKNNRDGRPDLQTERLNVLSAAVKVLQDNYGYSKHWKIQNFGDKEVHRLVKHSKELGNSDRTIMNKMVHYRWVNEKVGLSPVHPSNAHFGLSSNVVLENKAVAWDQSKIDKLDERMQLIFESKYVFGLREEESLKMRPSDHLDLKKNELYVGSGSKGARPRLVPLVTPEQQDLARRLIDFQSRNQDNKSLIPAGIKFNAYRHRVQRASNSLGVKGHGYRHAWAQARFEALSGGIRPVIAGGPEYKTLTNEERSRWDHAAKVVNIELGHGEKRHDVTKTYIGERG